MEQDQLLKLNHHKKNVKLLRIWIIEAISIWKCNYWKFTRFINSKKESSNDQHKYLALFFSSQKGC